MKVGIDTFGCNHGHSGIGSYLISLINELQNVDDISFELFGEEADRLSFIPAGGKVTFHGLNAGQGRSHRTWHQVKIDTLALKQHYDVIFYPAGSEVIPLFQHVPGVAVVNNVLSDLFRTNRNPFLKFAHITALKRTDAIIASSQFIRKDLISLGINPEKIEVIHHGIDHSHFYPHTEFEDDTVPIKPFSIKRPFIIYASRLQNAEKKHVELIKAFSLFKKQTSLPHRLVLAGDEGDYSDEVRKAASESEFASDIFITGYFPHEHLPELYSCADACIFPSVTEGVGLPVIEAMATGIPVACAKAGSLPEIAGDCAYYFNPDDIEETANAINTVITDTKVRERLLKGGFEWTKRFSWEKTAARTVEVLRQVYSQRSS
jgi:glycosyltransferase involved in cell wall biosynthesis